MLRSDIGWADDEAAERVVPRKEREANRAGFDVEITPLCVELRLS